MTLDQAKLNHSYIIKQLSSVDDEMAAKLNQCGFFIGARVVLKRKAPIFRDPLLVEVEGSQIVLAKEHAKNIDVEQCP